MPITMTELPPLDDQAVMIRHIAEHIDIIDSFQQLDLNVKNSLHLPAKARDEAEQHAEDIGAAAHIDANAVKTITSELVTNPERHTGQPPTFVALGQFSVEHAVDDGTIAKRTGLAVAVGDTMPGLRSQELKPEDEEGEWGHGLDIVRVMADEFGFVPLAAGKAAVAVWYLDNKVLIPKREAVSLSLFA